MGANFALGARVQLANQNAMTRNHFFVSLFLFLATLIGSPVQAQVQVHFYSRELSTEFPHALIIVEGSLSNGQKVSDNFGYTPRTVSPTILLSKVKGYVQAAKPDYIAKANRQFSVTVDDAGYARLMARIERWRALKQPSYSLEKNNCVHFIMDMADAVGLKVNRQSKFFKKPRSFLQEVRSLNMGSVS